MDRKFNKLFDKAMNAAKEADTLSRPSKQPKRKAKVKAKALGVKKAKLKKKKEADYDDEDSVLAEVAAAEDFDPTYATIKESHMTSFGTGTYYEIKLGKKSYTVARDEDEARELALAVVKQDLEQEPEIFNRNFIEGHINTDRLRSALEDDVANSLYENLKEEADRNPIEFMKEHDIEIPEPTDKEMRDYAEKMADDKDEEKEIYAKLKDGDAEDKWIEMGEEPKVDDRDIVAASTDAAAQQLKDPVAYLEDMYGKEDAMKQAIEIAGIDEDAAAEEAVDTDGWQHFLASYDGNSNETEAGFVYWRDN